MTAITPSYAHAYQLICLTGHIPAALHSKFRLPAAKARYPHLPNVRTTTRERGNFQGWALYTDGGTHPADGEALAGWGAVARTPHGRFFVMFGPVVTTEAHLAFTGARVIPTIPLKCRPLSKRSLFSGPRAQLPVMRILAFSAIPSMLPVFAWAQFMLARMYSLDSLANRYC